MWVEQVTQQVTSVEQLAHGISDGFGLDLRSVNPAALSTTGSPGGASEASARAHGREKS